MDAHPHAGGVCVVLGAFAVGADAMHSLLRETRLDAALAAFEHGGEMIVMSLLLASVYAQTRLTPQPAFRQVERPRSRRVSGVKL